MLIPAITQNDKAQNIAMIASIIILSSTLIYCLVRYLVKHYVIGISVLSVISLIIIYFIIETYADWPDDIKTPLTIIAIFLGCSWWIHYLVKCATNKALYEFWENFRKYKS